ncbi:MAG TPA: hypothetical protein VK116_07650, partial [Planctomycetota bacterium]|nr:hypothetical protein [Planctomycetota bacterium]
MLPRTLLSRLLSRAWPIAASFASVCAMAAACMGVLLVSPPAWTQIPRATDAPKPHSPEESRAMIRVRDGFEVDLVAAEPLIADPTAIAWDEHGRLFVAELHGYNLEGHLDVVELNKTGVLDREVRRIPASPEAREAAKRGTSGTVKILDDLDGDGRMDRARVIADGLPPCYGIIAARGGVIVTCAPDILYLADRDGDGDWKTRETLFTGLATGVLER